MLYKHRISGLSRLIVRPHYRRPQKFACSPDECSVRGPRSDILQEIFPGYGEEAGWTVAKTSLDEPVILAKAMGPPSIIAHVEGLISLVASGGSAQVSSTVDGDTEALLLSLPDIKPFPRPSSKGSRIRLAGSHESENSSATAEIPYAKLQTDTLLKILRDNSPEIEPSYPSNVPPAVLCALKRRRGPRGRVQRTSDVTSGAGQSVEDIRFPDLSEGHIGETINGRQKCSSAGTISSAIDRGHRISKAQSTFRSIAAATAGMVEASLPDFVLRRPGLGAQGAAPSSSTEVEFQDQRASVALENDRDPSTTPEDIGQHASSRREGSRSWDYTASGIRNRYRQQALWVMEEPGLGLPRSHPDHLEARKVNLYFQPCT